jgi:hypothetical protein
MQRWGRLAAVLLVAGALDAPTATATARGHAKRPDGPRRETSRNADSCRKLPPGRRIVKLNLKPDTELGDLIAWISSITCKQFVLPDTIPSSSKKVTIISPEPLTPEEAYRLFLSALESVGLTVYESGGFLRIIETSKAKTSPIPLYISDG